MKPEQQKNIETKLERTLTPTEELLLQKGEWEDHVILEAVEGWENVQNKEQINHIAHSINKKVQQQIKDKKKKKDYQYKSSLKNYNWLWIIVILTLILIVFMMIVNIK